MAAQASSATGDNTIVLHPLPSFSPQTNYKYSHWAQRSLSTPIPWNFAHLNRLLRGPWKEKCFFFFCLLSFCPQSPWLYCNWFLFVSLIFFAHFPMLLTDCVLIGQTGLWESSDLNECKANLTPIYGETQYIRRGLQKHSYFLIGIL